MKDIVTQLRTNSECLAPSIMLEAADTIERLREERDEARRLLKAVVDMMRDNMAPDANPKHLCDFVHRPDIAMCKVCEDWTDAMVMCYPDDFQDKEDGK
jgi:hypothetical protein